MSIEDYLEGKIEATDLLFGSTEPVHEEISHDLADFITETLPDQLIFRVKNRRVFIDRIELDYVFDSRYLDPNLSIRVNEENNNKISIEFIFYGTYLDESVTIKEKVIDNEKRSVRTLLENAVDEMFERFFPVDLREYPRWLSDWIIQPTILEGSDFRVNRSVGNIPSGTVLDVINFDPENNEFTVRHNNEETVLDSVTFFDALENNSLEENV